MTSQTMTNREMSDWSDLGDELDRWADAGLSATLWWRDDDAARATPALGRLLGLRAGLGIPLALAVVPAVAGEDLAAAIAGAGGVSVLQHGYAHRNHAGHGAPKAELGPNRAPDDALGELAAGRERLVALFGGPAAAVLVPPWNRIADRLLPRLGAAGYTGLSTYGPRARALAAPGVVQVNTHVELIDWRGGRGFVGEAAALGLAVGHLAARRGGASDGAGDGGGEPTGLLSHHLVHDEAAWDFIAAFVAATTAHSAARWLDAGEAFSAAAGGE